jgi:UDP-GlcNAc:undecaprenyl-phosphate/decaprenyl-phosphate GlcNAc-1-phosphate transferase
MLSFASMQLLYSCTIAMLLTTVLMPLAIRIAPVIGLMDWPDANRKTHVRVIPRCGSLAMLVGIAAPLIWYLPPTEKLLHLLIATAVIASFGLLDDRKDLDYRWKFLGQILAVLIVMHGGILISRVPLLEIGTAPQWLSYLLTFLFILGVTNAVNLTDGLDGLAAGTTLLALSVIFALTQISDNFDGAIIAVTVIGGILGFLRYNTFPARVFMGDAGSQFLGFIASCLGILVTQADTCAVSPALPLLILGLPVLDTITVMSIRLAQGRSPFSPDRNHLHHQIMALGLRHNEAVAIIYILQVTILAFAFLLRFAKDELLLGIYLAFCISVISILTVARRANWRVHQQITQPGFVERRSSILRNLPWFYRNSSFVVQGAMAPILLLPSLLPRTDGLITRPLKISVATIITLAIATYLRLPAWGTRISIYSASVLSVYLLAASPNLKEWTYWINVAFIVLACILALAIRLTRREQFRLDTQDLLILIIILVVPLLPFEPLDRYSIGEFSLRLAVLIYSCEFVVARTSEKNKLLPVNVVSVLTLALAIILNSDLV